MSEHVTVEDAQLHLKELIGKLLPGQVVILTENQRPVARLTAERPTRPAPGLGKGSVVHMAPDFDEPLEEFKDYME